MHQRGIQARSLPHSSLGAISEFLSFGVVGGIGFVVDASVLASAIALGLGPWLGRVLSYFAAASTNFGLNRAWTFRRHGRGRLRQQYVLFLSLNLVGFACNYAVYALLISQVPAAAAHPVLGAAAGAVAGLASNFTLSRRFAFGAQNAGVA
jgi:putative flippase GtrA